MPACTVRPPTRFRAACIPLLCILIGAVVNILIVVALSIHDVNQMSKLTKGAQGEMRHRNFAAGEGKGYVDLYWDTSRTGVADYWAFLMAHERSVPPPSSFGTPPPDWIAHEVVPWVVGAAPWPQGTQVDATNVEDSRRIRIIGWPMLCLYHTERATNIAPVGIPPGLRWDSQVHDGIPFQLGSRRRPTILPLHPLWPGLAANTLVYAALIAALSHLPRLTRSLIARFRRPPYACIDCGYDLRGLSSAEHCPECGSTWIPPRS